jgi:hypothetical protein
LPATAAWHVIHGIASRDTYLHGRCAADLWAAQTACCRLLPAPGGRGRLRGHELRRRDGRAGRAVGRAAAAGVPRRAELRQPPAAADDAVRRQRRGGAGVPRECTQR